MTSQRQLMRKLVQVHGSDEETIATAATVRRESGIRAISVSRTDAIVRIPRLC